jgi:hypothetical protein
MFVFSCAPWGWHAKSLLHGHVHFSLIHTSPTSSPQTRQ